MISVLRIEFNLGFSRPRSPASQLGPTSPPLFLPQANESLLVLPRDDPGIRDADEMPAVKGSRPNRQQARQVLPGNRPSRRAAPGSASGQKLPLACTFESSFLCVE